MPVIASGYARPVMMVSATTITRAGRSSFNIVSFPLCEAGSTDDEVDRLDPDERDDDAAEAVDQQVAAQQVRGPGGGADRAAVLDTFERQRDQRDDDQRVEDDRRQNGTFRRRQTHHVQRL